MLGFQYRILRMNIIITQIPLLFKPEIQRCNTEDKLYNTPTEPPKGSTRKNTRKTPHEDKPLGSH